MAMGQTVCALNKVDKTVNTLGGIGAFVKYFTLTYLRGLEDWRISDTTAKVSGLHVVIEQTLLS